MFRQLLVVVVVLAVAISNSSAGVIKKGLPEGPPKDWQHRYTVDTLKKIKAHEEDIRVYRQGEPGLESWLKEVVTTGRELVADLNQIYKEIYDLEQEASPKAPDHLKTAPYKDKLAWFDGEVERAEVRCKKLGKLIERTQTPRLYLTDALDKLEKKQRGEKLQEPADARLFTLTCKAGLLHSRYYDSEKVSLQRQKEHLTREVEALTTSREQDAFRTGDRNFETGGINWWRYGNWNRTTYIVAGFVLALAIGFFLIRHFWRRRR